MKKKTIIGGCLIILITVSFFYARRTSTLFNLLFPPSDLFTSLASQNIDLTKRGKVQLLFQPKYPGAHDLDLEVEKLNFGKPFKGKILLDVSVKNEKNESVLNRRIAGATSSFQGNQRQGFILESFMVPDQIGIGEKATVEVTILTADPDLKETYGSAKFVVNKGGDK
jgi:hypothetical protein